MKKKKRIDKRTELTEEESENNRMRWESKHDHDSKIEWNELQPLLFWIAKEK